MKNLKGIYKKIGKAILSLIKMSGYKNKYIAKRIGMKAASFSSKKKHGNWNKDEILLRLNTLKTPSVKLQNILEDMLDCIMIEQYSKGDTITSEEFEKKMNWV